MFDEYCCGCVVSPWQGRVRVCAAHRPMGVDHTGRPLRYQRATGDGGVMLSSTRLRGVVRRYPANGEMPEEGWNGR